MGNCETFDYYYGLEPEQFKFYQIPKALVEDARFQQLSDRAKILYSILRDRMSLSRSNGWIDAENRVYINFSVADIMSALNCSRASALKAVQELDVKTGIGLIEKKRVGQGNPNVIYVKNFNKVLSDIAEKKDDSTKKSEKIEQEYVDKSLANIDEYSEVYNLDLNRRSLTTLRNISLKNTRMLR